MPRRSRTALLPRKAPVQARSAQLVADILKAAIRVLEREGPLRFTTIRVAETAGVSVGSLYQYFPNKQAILFRLQREEWETTGALIDGLLGDASKSPAERLRAVTRAFFQSECDEAPLRSALDAALPNYHDAPESRAHRERSQAIMRAFLAAAAPNASPAERRFAGELLMMTVTAIGKQVSERRPTTREVVRWADATSEMLNAYLAGLDPHPQSRRTRPSMHGRVNKT